MEKCTEFGQLFYVNLNMGGKSMGEKAACEKSAGELGVCGGEKSVCEMSLGESIWLNSQWVKST